MNCPDCGSKNISISHRRGSEKFLKYIYPKTPYRCEECWSRFHVFENPFKTWQTKVIAGAVICFLLFIILLPLMRTPSSQRMEPETSTGETSGIQAPEENPIRPEPVSPPPETPPEQPVSGPAADAGAVITPKPDDSSLPFTTEDITEQPATPSTEEASPASPQLTAEIATPPAGEAPPPADASPAETASTPMDDTPSPGIESAAESAPKEALSSGGQEMDTANTFFEMKEGSESTKQTPESSEANAPALALPEDEMVTPPEDLPETPSVSSPGPTPVETASIPKTTRTPLKKKMSSKKPLFLKTTAAKKAAVIPPEKFIAQNKKALKNKKRRLENITINPSTTGFNAFFRAAPPLKFSTLTLTDPSRTIINIDGEWENPEPSVYTTQNRYVKQVRVGVHPSYLSIVLDMKTDAQMNVNIVESKGGLRVSLRP